MGDKAEQDAFSVKQLSQPRLLQADMLELSRHQHSVHALLEVDIGRARRSLKRAAGGPVSFSAYVVHCVARAVAADPRMQAIRQGRRVILFSDVDITVIVEKNLNGEHMPLPCILRAANRKTAQQIHDEIREAINSPRAQGVCEGLYALWLCLPARLRQMLMRMLLQNAWRRRKIIGTVAVSTLSMFGSGRGWGIPLTAHPLCVTTGGIKRGTAITAAQDGASHQAEQEEIMSLTLSLDHDLIDGAPAARFAERLRTMLEAGLPAEETQSGQ